jgi:hypothetical protein
MENFRDWLGIISSIGAIVAMIILFYRTFRDPDIKTEKDVDVMRAQCAGKHNLIDQQISQINENLNLIKVNHINHIENDIKDLTLGLMEIKTILNERLPKV